MNADEFAQLVRREKDTLIKEYFRPDSETSVGAKIKELCLDDSQISKLREIMDGALSDALYTMLLGLDGSASIGGVQQTYKIYDESGTVISDCGELEAAAFDHFQDS